MVWTKKVLYYSLSHLVKTAKIAEQRRQLWEKQKHLYENFDPEYTGVDLRQFYLLDNPEWNLDNIPEIMDGIIYLLININ